MILDLPYNFHYCFNKRTFASVKNNKLIICNNVNFEKLMYDAAYALHGKTECYYCNKKISKENATQDHLYPKNMGGVTITNNLVTACTHCNQKKSNFNENQFRTWQMLESKAQKKKYEESIRKMNEEIRYKRGFDLPDEWISYIPVDTINTEVAFNTSYKSKKYYKYQSFILNYGHMPRPVIVSNQRDLLDGYILIYAALNAGFKTVPTIVLENVEKQIK